MIFACYRGRSTVSGMIRWFTRSEYSHVALVTVEGRVFEAVSQGFLVSESINQRHEKGTVVDLFTYRQPLSEVEERVATQTCEKLALQKYDYASVFAGFPLRLNRDADPKRLFCSEAALAVSWALGEDRLLQRMPPWKAAPDHIAISPLLQWSGTHVIQ